MCVGPRSVLVLNCTDRHASSYDLTDDELREAIGGVSVALFVLERAMQAGEDAPLAFASGAFGSTPVPSGTEHAVAGISPVSGRAIDHLAPGHWSALMRRCGFAAIVLVGACARWTTIAIENRKVSWLDARDYLGLPSRDVTKRVREWYGDRSVRVCAIGEAGERESPFATIACDGRSGGRGGLGAVLGAKRVKAIALRGRGDVRIADLPRAERLAEDLRRSVLGGPTMRALSPASRLRERRAVGVPTRNFASADFAPLVDFSRAFEPRDAYVELRAGCAPCSVQCENMYLRKERDRRFAVATDVEGIWALGPLCGIEDGSAVLDALARCEAYGLDAVSTGVSLAFAMEAVERGALSADIHFGDGAALMSNIDAMLRGDGALASIGRGVRAAAITLDRDASTFAMHVDGIESGWDDPRGSTYAPLALALGARYVPRADDRSFVEAEDRATLRDALVLCPFAENAFAHLAETAAPLYEAVWGLEMDVATLHASARATYDRRVRLGARRPHAAHALPARFATPLPDGPHAGARVVESELALMLASYQVARA